MGNIQLYSDKVQGSISFREHSADRRTIEFIRARVSAVKWYYGEILLFL